MSITIFENTKENPIKAITNYLSTSDGLQDYSTTAGCMGDLMSTCEKTREIGQDLAVAGGAVSFMAKVPNAIISATDLPGRVMTTIKNPTFGNVADLYCSVASLTSTGVGMASSAVNVLWNRVASAIGISSGIMETTLSITSLVDQITIERFFESHGVDPQVMDALRETRIWRGICLGKSLAKLTARSLMIVMPFVSLPIAIGVFAVSSISSFAMSVSEKIYRHCVMDYRPVHPSSIKTEGNELSLIRDKTCVIL